LLVLGYVSATAGIICAVADAGPFCLQLKLMATVHQTQPNIQMLLATSDYVGALDLITATQDILMRDLAGIQSFRYFTVSLIDVLRLLLLTLTSFVVEFTDAVSRVTNYPKETWESLGIHKGQGNIKKSKKAVNEGQSVDGLAVSVSLQLC